MSSNELNNFDQFLKGKLESQNIPFNENDWNKLEKQLPQPNGKPFWSNPFLWSGAAVLAIVATTLILFQTNQEQINPELISQQEVIENTQDLNSSNSNTPINDTSSSVKIVTLEETTDNQNSIDEIISNVAATSTPNDISQKLKSDVETLEKNGEIEDNYHQKDANPVTPIDNSSKEITKPTFSKPNAEIIAKKTEICQNENIEFEAKTQENVDYIWDFGDGQFSKEQNPKHKFLHAGSFKVGLTVRSKADNSMLTKSNEILVMVNEIPNVNFETEEQINLGIPSISFINTTNKGNLWSWNFGDGNISMDKDPNYSYKRKGYYEVSLTSENEFKCTNTITKKVFVENDYNLLAPNSFTPNGDGINDYFIPEALKVMDVEFVMTVYSQNQGMLFETKNINQQWDGINQQTGEKCANGNYIWVVTLTTKEGKIEQYKGAVLILE